MLCEAQAAQVFRTGRCLVFWQGECGVRVLSTQSGLLSESAGIRKLEHGADNICAASVGSYNPTAGATTQQRAAASVAVLTTKPTWCWSSLRLCCACSYNSVGGAGFKVLRELPLLERLELRGMRPELTGEPPHACNVECYLRSDLYVHTFGVPDQYCGMTGWMHGVHFGVLFGHASC